MFWLRGSFLVMAVVLLAVAPALAWPSWAWDQSTSNDLPFGDCMLRAERTLRAEGFTGVAQQGRSWYGNTQYSVAYIICYELAARITQVTIGVSSDAGAPTGQDATSVRGRVYARFWGQTSGQTSARVLVHAPGGDWSRAVRSTSINYIGWDNSRWTARVEGNVFVHAPDGDWSRAHQDTIIKYKSWDNAGWTARVEGNVFVHAPGSDWSRAHRDTIINYISWDNARWTARFE